MWVDKGAALEKLGRDADAVVCLARAAELAPDAPHLWMNVAAVLNKLDRIDEAIAAVEEAARRGHADAERVLQELRTRRTQLRVGADALEAIGEIVAIRGEERHDEAIALCAALIADDPAIALAWFLKGDSELKVDRFENALASLRKAAALPPFPESIVPMIWRD